ncbi:O-antigen ligase [Salinibacter ruber]|uniref:O-antigen ligase n=1 Tax=Salinibacter ruber TaxID=146919 RepID=A0A9X2Q3Z1_9BACT|nr:O-antigen ligase family protein [Salinibacter ruber]MCS3677800.1 O-antigen ligase [Salinibacter ruber]MCS3681088.1 O-antigen ligase [Salinibacter ruber]
MYSIRFEKISIILLTTYFVAGYTIEVKEVRKIVLGESIVPAVIVLSGVIYLSVKDIKEKGPSLSIVNILPFHLYIVSSILVLSAVNLNSHRPAYSITRLILSLTVLSVSVQFFWQVLQTIKRSENEIGDILTNGLIALIVVLIVGEILIPRWGAGVGGIRMSGGSNPNKVAFMGLFSVFWGHYSALRQGKWKTRSFALCTLGVVVIAWSLSRSVILSLIMLYVFYYVIIGLSYVSWLINGILKKGFLKTICVMIMIIIIPTVFYPTTKGYVDTLQKIQGIEQRLSSEGLRSRVRAWEDLWPHFINAPLTGQAGWWNSTNLNSLKGGSLTADSPHNLYVRLLSEVGLLGLLTILAFPAASFVCTLYALITQKCWKKKFKIYAFIISSTTSLFFVSQMFEDKYLVGIGGVGSGIVTFVVTCSFVELYINK